MLTNTLLISTNNFVPPFHIKLDETKSSQNERGQDQEENFCEVSDKTTSEGF